MNKHITAFKQYLTVEKKSSNNTVESYIRDLMQFSDYCASLKLTSVSKIKTSVINSYLDFLTKQGKSDATKARITASLRAFFRYLVSIGAVSENPVTAANKSKVAKKLPGVLDSSDIIKLLSQPSGDDYKSIRDKAMLELLYATGIKVSELLELRVYDFNVQLGILHLRNGKKERIIPIYPAAIKSVSEYLTGVRPAIVLETEQDKLFTNMNGQPMSRQGFWKLIKHYADEAGIKEEITPHTLRHSFAAHLLENGAKLQDIKEMLGHSDISSTQIYAQYIKSKYTASYAKFHPLAK
ncbi:MAG: tyrosine recombinase [Clostridia bacterium]|nr:tyrosine recombinase [Clostridia bacterium]